MLTEPEVIEDTERVVTVSPLETVSMMFPEESTVLIVKEVDVP